MAEKPIIFSSEMVRAILEGRKTQTRRVIKPQPEKDPNGTKYNKSGYWCAIPGVGAMVPVHYLKTLCPYGKVGDRLWVRETFGIWCRGDCTPEGRPYDPAYLYRATDSPPEISIRNGIPEYALVEPFRWKPSIFMPKKAARIWLEITAIRVERVQEITLGDIICEGGIDKPMSFEDAVEKWIKVWDSINKKRGYEWEKNPFVWVIEFRRIDNE